jgi:hypothetical protein
MFITIVSSWESWPISRCPVSITIVSLSLLLYRLIKLLSFCIMLLLAASFSGIIALLISLFFSLISVFMRLSRLLLKWLFLLKIMSLVDITLS